MSFGMTYDEFWNGDNEMPKMFRRSHEIRQKETDRQAWLQGAYIYQAVGALAPALKAFAKGKVRPYLEHPFSHEIKPFDFEAPKYSKEEKSDDKARTWLEMWAISFNDRFEKDKNLDKKGGEEDGRRNNTRN